MNTRIIEALRSQQVLELRYSGYSRIVECHAYGRDKDSDEILRCYQVSGGSSSGEISGWKLLKVREVFSLRLLKDKFSTRKDYKRGDKAMKYIFEEL